VSSAQQPPDSDGNDAPDRELSLSNLKPASKRTPRKRVGRGLGSGHGRYCGRGIKGQKSRSGSHKLPAGFEGGQMPIHMRMPKQRGSTSKDALPIGPHRTSTQPVNVRDLERVFDDGADVTLDSLVEKGLVKHLRIDIKILGDGDLTKKLAVTAHRFSTSARAKIESAGGSVVELKTPKERKRRRSRSRPKDSSAAADTSEEVAEAAEASADPPNDDPTTEE
jgi:large subunit ribosomal protein L15